MGKNAKNGKDGTNGVAAPESGELMLIELGRIVPTKDNPRSHDEGSQDFKDMMASIARQGMLQPGVARPHPQKPGYYDLRAGAGRYQAAKRLGWAAMPLMVREMDDATAMEVTTVENLQRKGLTALEECEGIGRLARMGRSLAEIAGQLGKSVGWVARRAALGRLDQRFVEAHRGENKKLDLRKWTPAMLELVAALPDEAQAKLWQYLTDHNWNVADYELGDLDATLGRFLHVLHRAPWKQDDGTLPGGACALCVKRSGCQPDLFASLAEEAGQAEGRRGADKRGLSKDDTCLDGACWDKKMMAFLERRETEMREKHGPELVKVSRVYVGENDKKRAPALAGALNPHEFQACKKTEPGARPALVVGGGGTGSVTWIKPQGRSGESKAQKAEKKELTMKEKRAALAVKRRKRACELLLEDLAGDKAAAGDLGDNSYKAAAVILGFGFRNYDDRQSIYAMHEYVKRATASTEALDQKMIVGAMDTQRRELHSLVVTMKSYDNGARYAAQICAVWGWDWNDYVARATEAIPEPKGWATEKKSEERRVKGEKGAQGDTEHGQTQTDTDKAVKSRSKPAKAAKKGKTAAERHLAEDGIRGKKTCIGECSPDACPYIDEEQCPGENYEKKGGAGDEDIDGDMDEE